MESECQRLLIFIVKGLELQSVPFMLHETSAGSVSQGIHLPVTDDSTW